jgi:hypothetical protein
MKKSVFKPILGLLFFLSFTGLYAQGGDSMPAERISYRMKNYLNLNEEQTLSIRDIFREQGKKRKEIHKSDMDQEAKRSAIRTNAMETDRRIRAVLTDEQQKGYEQIREKIRDERKEKGEGKKQGQRPPAR